MNPQFFTSTPPSSDLPPCVPLNELEHLVRTGAWQQVMAIAHAKLAHSGETRIDYHTQNLAEAALAKMRNAAMGKISSDTLRQQLADPDPEKSKKAQESLRKAYETLAYLGSLPLLDEARSTEAKTMGIGDANACQAGCLSYLRRAMLSVLNDARRKRSVDGRRAEDLAEAEQAEFLADNIGDLLPLDIRASDRATKGRAIAIYLQEFYDAHPTEAACLLAYAAMILGKRGVNVDAPHIEAIYEQLAGAGIGCWDAERRVYHGLDTAVADLGVTFGTAKPDDKPEAKQKAGQRAVLKARTLLAPFLRARGILPSGQTNPISPA